MKLSDISQSLIGNQPKKKIMFFFFPEIPDLNENLLGLDEKSRISNGTLDTVVNLSFSNTLRKNSPAFHLIERLLLFRDADANNDNNVTRLKSKVFEQYQLQVNRINIYYRNDSQHFKDILDNMSREDLINEAYLQMIYTYIINGKCAIALFLISCMLILSPIIKNPLNATNKNYSVQFNEMLRFIEDFKNYGKYLETNDFLQEQYIPPEINMEPILCTNTQNETARSFYTTVLDDTSCKELNIMSINAQNWIMNYNLSEKLKDRLSQGLVVNLLIMEKDTSFYSLYTQNGYFFNTDFSDFKDFENFHVRYTNIPLTNRIVEDATNNIMRVDFLNTPNNCSNNLAIFLRKDNPNESTYYDKYSNQFSTIWNMADNNLTNLDTYEVLINKLKKALKEEFYHEAIFIEQAMFEDRINAVLKYAGIEPTGLKLSDKVNKLKDSPIFNNECIKEELPTKMFDDILEWERQRNSLLHSFADLSDDEATLKSIATNGDELTEDFNNKINSVNEYFSKFTINDDGTLTNYTGTEEIYIVIPANVKTIGGYCFADNKEIKKVLIPFSVTSIGYWAFSGCSSLTEVNIPESVTSIGNGVFNECCHLIEINIPNNVTSIGENAFNNCRNLTKVNIPDGITSISDWAFRHCSSLTKINIPKGVISIRHCAFSGCSNLTEINIPEGVTFIGNYVFDECRRLTEINIPNNVTSIGENAFNNCCSLNKVNIPESVTSIGHWAFRHCSSLTKINIPKGVASIGHWAFSGCSSLIEVNIPESVTFIGTGVFNDCRSLTKVNIPDGITSISDCAFSGCSNLTEINIPKGVELGNNVFDGCSKDLKIIER